MDYLAGNSSEQATGLLPSTDLSKLDDDAKLLSELTPRDISLEVVAQNRVRLGYMGPDKVIRSYNADIMAYAPGHSKADDCEDLKVGTLVFHVLNLAFPGEKGKLADHPRDICDCHSVDMLHLYEALYHGNGRLKRAVANRLAPDAGPWYCAYAILYVELLSIDAEFRGRKFGPAALETAIRHYGLGCEFAVLAARAFETGSKTPEGIAYDKRLIRMYKKQGFVPLPKSRYMVRSLETYAPHCDWLDR